MSLKPPSTPPQIALVIPWSTFGKIFLAWLLFLAAQRLWTLVIPLLLSLLLAITLTPLLQWTQKRGWPRWAGLTLCICLLLGVIGLAVGAVVPKFVDQATSLVQKAPELRANALGRLPEFGGWRDSAQKYLEGLDFSDAEPFLKNFVVWGGRLLGGLLTFFIILVFAIYFLVDGPRVFEWLDAFLPERHRRRVDEAAPEIVSVVGHYVAGQLTISALCAVFTFTSLTILHVPNALVLAIVAGILDVLPVLGIVISCILAVGLALTVSASTAVIVACLYLAYHLVENYFILPKVYGNRLKLSALTILLSCLGAVELLGFVGAVLVLPIVASYPIIERIWLRPWLERDTVRRHEELDREATGSST